MEFIESLGYIFLFLLPVILTFIFKQTLRRPVSEEPQTMQINAELNVKAFNNPFSISLDCTKSNYKDGLFVDILRSNKTVNFNMVIAWTVNITDFYDIMEQDFKECFYAEDKLFLSEISQHTQLHFFNLFYIKCKSKKREASSIIIVLHINLHPAMIC